MTTIGKEMLCVTDLFRSVPQILILIGLLEFRIQVIVSSQLVRATRCGSGRAQDPENDVDG